MATQVSPGVVVSEVDLTAGVQATSLSGAGFVGLFEWGPALDVITVTSETDLVRVFGKPDANNYKHWFTAQSFLAYSNQLRVVRAIPSNALNATAAARTLTGSASVDVSSNATLVVGDSGPFTGLVNGQTIVINGIAREIDAVVNANAVSVTVAFTSNISAGNTVTAYGALIKNEDQHDDEFSAGNTSFGLAAARWPGDKGNSLRVSLCASANAFKQILPTGNIAIYTNSAIVGTGTSFDTTISAGDLVVVGSTTHEVSAVTNATHLTVVTAPTSNTTATANATVSGWSHKWAFADFFTGAPGTSAYANNVGGSKDEMHVVVVDQDGLFTGTRGTVLERYAFVSKASDAKDASGNINYYKTILDRQSAYVWWMGHVTGSTTYWGSPASSGAFGASLLNYYASLAGGNDVNEDATDGIMQTGWDLFADADAVDVALLVTGPPTLNEAAGVPTLADYVIDNIAEVRKDCVAFVSPLSTSVVNNSGSEVDDITTDRNNLTSSSYAFMDSGWKYQYDKYNDVYRWIPLNGDIAGLAARADTTNDPWFSPAGFNRGIIKNVVKLAYNPKQADRDDLYNIGVNPVVSFPAQGVLLYGDKTLLNRPSAFDRLNVRRLFIALEKTIARYAKAQLFEFNDEYTRSAFRNAVDPYLRDVKARRGITDYLVVCDGTNNTAQIVDSNQFVGDIYVKPARSINFIQLNFVAVRSGVSFQEIVGVA